MSIFRYASTRLDKKTKPLDKAKFDAITSDRQVIMYCDAARAASERDDKAAYEANKYQLPVAFYCGFNEKGKREKEYLTPTQYYMIDIDHAKLPAREIWQDLYQNKMLSRFAELDITDATRARGALDYWGISLVHETPSDGLRIIARCTMQFTSLKEHIEWFGEYFHLEDYGKNDTVVNDLSRCSFMVKKDWIIYENPEMWEAEAEVYPILPESGAQSGGQAPGTEPSEPVPQNCAPRDTAKLPEITEKMRNFEFNGKRCAEIAEDYIMDKGGVPEEGLRHGFYNDLIKDFRNICDNDPRIVFAVLPLCEGTPEKRWSQCTSICKTNNTSQIPKDFYLWLKKRGYVVTKKDKEVLDYMDQDEPEKAPLPPLPPVFREFCSICPKDFVYPTIVGLMPVMGTLTSFVRADYIDLTEQSTTFFSTIWAPPSAGKSFAKRLVDMLMSKIRLRDEMNDLREQLWLIDQNTKADDEKGKDLPHVMVRIMPAINSLPEFLEKMRDNHGYHMFTFAEEVDTFKKGSSSGGADKSDLFRTAWDNSEYGQSFKSTATFKGKVRIFYNILLTGTPGAVKKYYSNVEDGMVTRISICEIENQQFAEFQAWKPLTNKQREVIERFVERCDENTYRDPVEMTSEEVHLYNTTSANYDKHVNWRFTLKEKTRLDMSWLFPTIKVWLEKTRRSASLANDLAADTFRRRCAVKGFRLAMVCMCCWSQVREREKKIIRDFVLWFMDRDLYESLKMFGEKYNKLQNEAVVEASHHQDLFESLPDEFTKNDVISACMKLGVHSKVKVIIYRWKKDKVITKVNGETYKKVKS